MPDLVIDYELLYNAAGKLDSVKGQVATITGVATYDGYVPTTGSPVSADDLGPGNTGAALANFYWNWIGLINDAGKQIDKLSATFRGVARAYFDADASQSGAVNAGLAMSAARNYPAEYDAYQKALAAWEKLPDPNHVAYYDINGNVHYMSIPKPQPPDQPPTTVTGPNGVTTSYTTNGTDPNDPNHGPLITSETTTYSVGGMTYTETTTFGPDKGWANGGPVQDTVTSVTHSDGTVDNITTQTNLDGSATSTTTSKSPDGTSSSTTQTRQDWNSPWVTTSTDNTTPPPDYPPAITT